MLALYGLGDTAGALRCFEEARAALADGLGIDPGPELQRIHRDILNHDAALPAPRPTVGQPPAVAAAAIPRHLPLRPAVLVGRHHELHTIVAAFEQPPPADHPLVAVVSGPVGTGKSALAVSAASRLAPTFPDGQLYVDLSAPEPHPGGRTAAHLATLLRSLGDPPADLSSGVAAGCCRLRSLLADRRMLMLLDNATDASDVRPLLPATASNGVIVTSRRVLTTLDVAVSVRLGPLPAGEALTLLGRLIGDDRVAAAPAAATEVVRRCGYLPLAIRIAAARLLRRSEWSLPHLATRLRAATGVLDEFAADDLSLRDRLLQVYRELDPAAAAAFVLYGSRRLTDATPDVVAEALGLPVPAAVVALDELVDAHLAVPAPTDAYRVLEFPARLAAELAAAS